MSEWWLLLIPAYVLVASAWLCWGRRPAQRVDETKWFPPRPIPGLPAPAVQPSEPPMKLPPKPRIRQVNSLPTWSCGLGAAHTAFGRDPLGAYEEWIAQIGFERMLRHEMDKCQTRSGITEKQLPNHQSES